MAAGSLVVLSLSLSLCTPLWWMYPEIIISFKFTSPLPSSGRAFVGGVVDVPVYLSRDILVYVVGGGEILLFIRL